MTQASISKGRRMSTARCYLDPARMRPNLTVETGALAESLILEGNRCVGVRYAVRGQKREARAAREVIVSAGAIASPQLLELSGIGQADRLKALGIEVRHDLAGRRREPARPLGAAHEVARRPSRRDLQRARARPGRPVAGPLYITARTGFLSLPASPLRAFFKTREGLDSPDAMLTVQPFLVTPDLKLAKEPGMTIITHQLRPESKGSIHVTAADAAQAAGHPLQLPGRAHRPRLRARLHAHRAAAGRSAPPLAWLGAEEFAPGPKATSDERVARLRDPHGRDHLSPGRHLQDGQRPGRRRRRPPARARDLRLARRRCLDHADADLRQHQRAIDHDRREGGPHGAGGRGVILADGKQPRRAAATVPCRPRAGGCG